MGKDILSRRQISYVQVRNIYAAFTNRTFGYSQDCNGMHYY